MFSEMTLSSSPLSGFPTRLPDPSSYLRGVDPGVRIRARNALVFLRTSRRTLQQRNFSDRVHHRHVLMLTLQTAGRVSLDGSIYSLEPGRALLVLPYQFHHYIDLADEQLRWLFITFELDEGAALVAEAGQRVLHPTDDDLALWRSCVALWRDRQQPAHAAELLAVLDQLLTRLAMRAALPLRAGQAATAPRSWIARVEATLAESIMQGETLADVARRVGLSERQLRTRFEAETGVAIRRYKANYQLHRAASLLSQPELSLGRIAELSGFHSQAVFNRFIRRETGLTPSAWRNSLAR
jgi:AraC-like DNA-binding protein